VAAALTGVAGCTVGGPTDATATPGDASTSGAATGTATTGDTAGGTGDSTAETTGGDEPTAVGLETLASGFSNPLDAAFPAEADRTYVAEQPGTIRVLDADGSRSGTLLDLRETVEAGGEKGLLGIALHPEFDDNRRLFVRYSAPSRPGTPRRYSHTFVLAEFEVGVDGNSARRDSERTVLEIPQPQGNHNAGSIVFGPEGFLYVGVGDGGAGDDRGSGHVDDWYDDVEGGNGQDVTANLLGSVLRIDVDGREGGQGYAVPVTSARRRPGLDEQYAWGFRNPWRLAVDDTGCTPVTWGRTGTRRSTSSRGAGTAGGTSGREPTASERPTALTRRPQTSAAANRSATRSSSTPTRAQPSVESPLSRATSTAAPRFPHSGVGSCSATSARRVGCSVPRRPTRDRGRRRSCPSSTRTPANSPNCSR
jgi:Glucose/sorbosone dehydrogenases